MYATYFQVSVAKNGEGRLFSTQITLRTSGMRFFSPKDTPTSPLWQADHEYGIRSNLSDEYSRRKRTSKFIVCLQRPLVIGHYLLEGRVRGENGTRKK